MKLVVSFTGPPAERSAAVRDRAVALLMAMEQEFGLLKVEISDGKAPAQSAQAGEDGELAGTPRKAAARGSLGGKATYR